MLWGTAVALALTIFEGFLHAYGWAGSLPNFSAFMAFWSTALLVKVLYRFRDRTVSDD